MFDFTCPLCGREYHANESQVGKQIRCLNTNCQEIVTIIPPGRRQSDTSLPSHDAAKADLKGIDAFHHWKSRAVTWGRKRAKPVLVTSACLVFTGLVFFAGYSVRTWKVRASKTASLVNQSPVNLESGLEPTPQPTSSSSSGQSTAPLEVSPAPIELQPEDVSSVQAEVPSPTHRARRQLPIAQATNSLPTGTEVSADQGTSGHGELEAINGTSHDACVIVTTANTLQRVRKRYVRAQDSFTLSRLEPGDYKVVFATGIDWNDSAERFNREASYFEFGRILSFAEMNDSQGIRYSHHSITLNPVMNGNVRSRPISEAEFHSLSGTH